MRFSSRSKVSGAISFAIALFLVGAFSFYGFVSSTNTAYAASATTSYKGTLGKAQLAGTANPAALSKASGHATYKVMPMRGRPVGGSASPTVSGRPNAVSTSVAAGSLLHNFNGVDAIDNSTALGGLQFEPPDESVAAANGYVLNFVNLTGAIYRDNGQLAAGPFPLVGVGSNGGFFNANVNNTVSDPRAYYDAMSHTWFALVWEDDIVNGAPGPAYVDLAVNTGNPVTSTWKIYKIDVTDANAAGCPCLPDYTIIGVDQYNVYLLPNEFQNFGAGGFNGSQIYVIAKSDLINGVASPNVIHFSGLSVAGVIAYHLQPANEHTSANAEYFMNSLDPNNTFDNRLGVWAMTNRDKVAQGVIPNLSATVIGSEAYAMPVNAQTPPGVCPCPGAPFNGPLATSGVVTADFDALQELQYINGHLFTELNTSVNIAGDASARDGVAWFDVVPALSSGSISSKSYIAAQGYLSSRGLYLMYPHVEHTFSGNTVVVFTFGGPGTYLSAGYAVMRSGAKNFGNIQVAAAGVTSDNGFTSTSVFGGVGRWGDYSAGQLDPSGNGVWFATQYIPNNGDQFANWGDRVFEVAA